MVDRSVVQSLVDRPTLVITDLLKVNIGVESCLER
jgi:hypothetical protein